MAFVASAGGFHDSTTSDSTPTFLDASAPKQHHHYQIPSASSMQNPPNQPYYPQVMSDIKPRLTKEQHDILESEFQKQQKPSTVVKKGFAENLNVSLDKVNNWFQNRRAKSKQDAKKQASAYNLYPHQNPPALNFNSDSDTSPSLVSPEYYAMMQDDHLSNNLGLTQASHFPQQSHINVVPFSSNANTGNHFNQGLLPPQAAPDAFDSPQDMNRRTLTQAQFDELSQHANSSGQFGALQHNFSGDAEVLNQVFPQMNQADFKQQHAFAYPALVGAPLSSNDSSIPSTVSENSMFPSSTTMQDHAALSSTSSDWGDSRSSSVSASHAHEQAFPAMQANHSQATVSSSSQWQPGTSVPVDPNDLQRQFTEAQQRHQQQQQQQQAHQQQRQHYEQPLAFPVDDAYDAYDTYDPLDRRDSQSGIMLAEHMKEFAIQTPQPPQNSTFKMPAPPQANGASIAARRQRPRPANLGMASMRSASYSGAAQPGSPSHTQTSQNLAPGQTLRRIRSSNVVITGGVAQGRVMKSMPGSAQRSPMSWTFQDALNSPNVNTTTRHNSTSSGNLAPPTPMSPSELPRQEPQRPQFPPWQSASGHFGRHASISETDAEHLAANSGQSQPVSSPPHTPMYHSQQQAIAQGRVGNTVVTENTPPQSAPAVQTSFPANACPPVAAQVAQTQPQLQSNQMQQAQQAFMQAPAQHFLNEQQYQLPASYGSGHNLGISGTEVQAALPMQFANGVPIVNAQGNLTLAYPPQMQHMQFMQPASTHPQQMTQAAQYNFMSSSGVESPMHVTSQMPKQPSQPATDFFVHEYSPPSDIKRAATPRRAPGDSLPKQFTFANQGPEHFEKNKAKHEAKASGTASSSPASAVSS